MAQPVHLEDPSNVDKVTNQPAIVQQEILDVAQDATDQDHKLSLRQCVKLYPKAIGWSVLLSTALVMEGYDTKLVPSLFAQPMFQEAYGEQQPDGSYEISAAWQGGLTNGSAAGQIIGLTLAGYLTERFGYRKTMISGLMALTGLIFIQFFAPNIIVLEVAQVLIGLPLGIFQTVTTVYAVEVTPTALRAYLTSYINLCWVFGQVIASGTLRGVLERTDHFAYRIPFALQWIWPVPLIVGIYFAPESPWWLVRMNRIEEAKASLLRLTSTDRVSFDVEKAIVLMRVTTEREWEENSGTSYFACFRGTARRRTLIAIAAYCFQVTSGNGLRSYSTYFFTQAGLPTTRAFDMTIVGYGLGVVGVIIAWFLIPRVGRRTMYLGALSAFVVIYTIIGGIGVHQVSSSRAALAWAIGGLLLSAVFVYNISIGPVAYSLVSEIPSAVLRSKSVAIARMAYNASNIVSNAIAPYQLNPSAWGWGARAGFFWAGSSLISLVITYFFIPEPKDRTVAELDMLFERKVSARHFSRAQVQLNSSPLEKAEA